MEPVFQPVLLCFVMHRALIEYGRREHLSGMRLVACRSLVALWSCATTESYSNSVEAEHTENVPSRREAAAAAGADAGVPSARAQQPATPATPCRPSAASTRAEQRSCCSTCASVV